MTFSMSTLSFCLVAEALTGPIYHRLQAKIPVSVQRKIISNSEHIQYHEGKFIHFSFNKIYSRVLRICLTDTEDSLYWASLNPVKARSNDPFLRIRFLLVPKIGSFVRHTDP